SRSRSRRSRARSAMSSSGSAPIGCCSPPTIPTGTWTTRATLSNTRSTRKPRPASSRPTPRSSTALRKLEKHVVARVEEVAPGKPLVRQVKGRQIGIFNLNGEYFALLNRCPHQSAELCRGRITHLVQADRAGEFRVSRRGELIKCPWHGWEFDIRTGQSWCD